MLIAILLLTAGAIQTPDLLADGFKNPPLSARPQTWWHWMDGNVTKQGITADLEAMKQVGIGGAQIFSVSQDIPPGPAKYAGPIWREMTNYAIKEASRLGLEICIHNGAGWSSSGGPWIQPADAMQVIAWSEVKVEGPTQFSQVLPPAKAPRVEAVVPYYKDIAVYAYPTPAAGDVVTPQPADFLQKTGVERGDGLQVDLQPLKSDIAIPSKGLAILTNKLDAHGRLTWSVPAGNWTILRMGHVPTGIHNHPAPPEGEGLEVDKLSKEALDKHWAAVVAKVIKDAGPLTGETFDNVLIDSYEVGTQNWSPKFRDDFQKRRGYDPIPYLPVVAGRIIDSKEKSERFLWDLRKTIAELYAANYYGHFAELAHQNGMKFSTEPYGNGGFDTMQSGSKADIPMAEFWLGGGAMETTKMVSSIGHTYGRAIVGAESFTGDIMPGRWREEPYMLKALGDLAFCNGVNRYIFHRYAMQPWLTLRPGMTMGPWGTHLERTQTWWTEAASWMRYIARCQYLLQAGQFRADACYYYGENSPKDLPYGPALQPQLPPGHDYDGCDADVLRAMSVQDGKVVAPGGVSYSLLILPSTGFMTPPIARKLRELVAAGATVYGPKADRSPSLTGYPVCDVEVRRIADQLWGAGDNTGPGSHAFGKGLVVWGKPLGDVLATLKVAPDFDYTPHNYGTKLVDIHRRMGIADVYFVSNQRNQSVKAACTFRVSGLVPELWHPETGRVEDAPVYSESHGRTTVPLSFDTAESVFVVFRKPGPKVHFTSFELVDKQAKETRIPMVVVKSARYESAEGRGADVTGQVQAMVRDGQLEIPATNAVFGDPVVNVVKRLVVDYTLDGKPMKQSVGENDVVELLHLPTGAVGPKAFNLVKKSSHVLELTSWQPGIYVGRKSTGGGHTVTVGAWPSPLTLNGPWRVAFPPNLGAPTSTTFDKLIWWNNHLDPGIKYFSGSATYSKDFTVPEIYLKPQTAVRINLGEVKNFATVTLNGHQIAILWKPPFTLEVTKFLRKGSNHLEVKVTNLWPNRIIGDEQLPPDVEWNGDHLKRWPDWLLSGKPRPKTGRITFETWHFYDKDSALLDSGMLGPVTLQAAQRLVLRL